MIRDHVAARTLVKSPPELWAECSDAGSLARHIGEFGEITITRLEPETSVAWEGELASGTVLIEPSGWGTRVTLTAQTRVEHEAVEDHSIEDEPVEEKSVGYEPFEYEPISEEEVEEADETLEEEAVAEPDHALVEGPGPIRRRWWRLIGRFRTREDELEAVADERDLELEREPDYEPELEMTPDFDPEPEPEPAWGVEPDGPELLVTAEPARDPDPDANQEDDPDRVDAEAILTAALDSLGQAHHRPFSRA